MMMIFIVTLVAMLLVVAGMAVGVMCGRKPLKGSCGGLNAIGLNGECKICGRTSGSCEEDKVKAETSERALQLGRPAL